jgi:hypothetical protein
LIAEGVVEATEDGRPETEDWRSEEAESEYVANSFREVFNIYIFEMEFII